MTSYTKLQKITIKSLLSWTDDIDNLDDLENFQTFSSTLSGSIGVTECCIWKGWPAYYSEFPDSEGVYTWKAFYSPRSGGWYIADSSIYDDNDLKISSKKGDRWISYTDLQKAVLTTWFIEERKKIKERKELGIPMLTRELLEKLKNEKPLSVAEKASKLLSFIAKSYDMGETIPIFFRGIKRQDENNPRQGFFSAYSESKNINELNGILDYLDQSGFIDFVNDEGSGLIGDAIILTLNGKAETEKVVNKNSDVNKNSNVNKDSDEIFVAMWFDKSVNDAYDAIKNGIEQAGYKPVRIDNLEHNKKIDDEIIAAIKRARLVVAEFTHGEKGARGGVYYEAGFAHGLGINVVFTCRGDIIGKIHFNTRQYKYIIWTKDKLDDFTQQIAKRISTTVGDGPYKGKN